jgi:uncharacterized protein YfaS (alpha-2-macroglobulin family)
MSAGERWLLAAAYQLANQPDAAAALVRNDKLEIVASAASDYTFGSRLRDRAIVLQGLVALGRDAEAAKLLDDISGELADGNWYSTQSVAFALVSVARYARARPLEAYGFEYTLAGGRSTKVTGDAAIASIKLPPPAAQGMALELHNTSSRTLYASVAVRGIARSGEEDAASNGLAIEVAYSDANGQPLGSVSKLTQGSDLIAAITIRNTSRRRLENLALTQMVPAGWEIRNERTDGGDALGALTPAEPRAGSGWWWVPDGSHDATSKLAEYVDIRDDRILQYFGLRAGDSIIVRTRLNAAYLGRYYLPGISTEAMYDASRQARQKGQWVEVIPARH